MDTTRSLRPSRLTLASVLMGAFLALAPASVDAACGGDCDGSGGVSAAEIDLAVDIALERAALSSCMASDVDGDEIVRIGEVVAGVGHSVSGCSVAFSSIGGQVTDADTGLPIANAAVTVVAPSFSASADDNGFFTFSNIPVGTVVMRFEHERYASLIVPLQVTEGAPALHPIVLEPLGIRERFDPAVGVTAQHGTAFAVIGPDSVVDAQGTPVTGEVELVMTKLDAVEDLASFPGSFDSAMDASGNATRIETFGFAEFELEQNGQPLNLAPGKTAQIEYQLPESAQGSFLLGQQVALWDLDETTGTWVQSPTNPTGTIIDSTATPGKLAWTANVPHFSWWNIDVPWPDAEVACLTGLVLMGGQPVLGAHVTAVGLSYNSRTIAFTDPLGRYCIEVKKGSRIRIEIRLNAGRMPVSTLEVMVEDVNRRCENFTCQEVPTFEVSLASCVKGRVTDPAGNAVVGEDVFVVPGGRAVTDATGRYCAPAPADTDVFVFAVGRLAVRTRTPAVATCGNPADCATANITLSAPANGDLVGQVFATATQEYEDSTFTGNDFDAQALFFAFSGEGFDFPDDSGTVTSETIDGCQVITLTATLFCPSPTFSGCRPIIAAGVAAQDPGNPGWVSNGTNMADMIPGDPFSTDPPQPWMAGVFDTGAVDLTNLGFMAGQQVMFSWPGGTDIGAFEGMVNVPANLQLLTPNVMAASIGLTANQPFTSTWTADPGSMANFEIRIIRLAAMSFPTPVPGGFQATARATAIICNFPDSAGTGTISANVTQRLSGGIAQIERNIQWTRDAVMDVDVPLERTGGMARVKFHGQAAIARQE